MTRHHAESVQVGARRTWLRLTALSPALLVLGVVVLNAAGWIIDASSMEQAEDSWGFAFAGIVLGFYALWVLGFMLFLLIMSAVFSEAHEGAVCAWIAAGAACVTGVVLGLLAISWAGDSTAALVFGAVMPAVGLLLQVPLVMCRRVRRSETQLALQRRVWPSGHPPQSTTSC